IKLLWVLGAALALSGAGVMLLAVATGTREPLEQWAVLSLAVDPEFLWRTALPLSLLLGVVLVGGAPFHFWAADLLQGAPAWLAPAWSRASYRAGRRICWWRSPAPAFSRASCRSPSTG